MYPPVSNWIPSNHPFYNPKASNGAQNWHRNFILHSILPFQLTLPLTLFSDLAIIGQRIELVWWWSRQKDWRLSKLTTPADANFKQLLIYENEIPQSYNSYLFLSLNPNFSHFQKWCQWQRISYHWYLYLFWYSNPCIVDIFVSSCSSICSSLYNRNVDLAVRYTIYRPKTLTS